MKILDRYIAVAVVTGTLVALLVLLIAHHLYCGKLLLDFKNDRNQRSHVWFRWFNEFPALILIAVVLLAVLRPA